MATYHLKKPYITWYGLQYESGKQFVFDSPYDYHILQINELDVHRGEARIVGILATQNGLTTETTVILKKNAPFEYWISCISHLNIAQLIKINWTTRDEIKKYKLLRKCRMKYTAKETVWYHNITYCKCGRLNGNCKCKVIKWVKCKVLNVQRPKFMGQMEPCYYIQPYSRYLQNCWTVESQLFKELPTNADNMEYPTVIDLLISNIMLCPQYNKHCMMDCPLYLNIDSAYWNKRTEYENDIDRINDNVFYTFSNEIEYRRIVDYILSKTFGQTVKPTQILRGVNVRGTKANLFKFASFQSEYRMNFELIPFLESKGIVIEWNNQCIDIDIDMESLQQFRSNGILIKEQGGSKVEVASAIKMRWLRSSCELYVVKYKYVYRNEFIQMVDDAESSGDDEMYQNELAELSDSDMF